MHVYFICFFIVAVAIIVCWAMVSIINAKATKAEHWLEFMTHKADDIERREHWLVGSRPVGFRVRRTASAIEVVAVKDVFPKKGDNVNDVTEADCNWDAVDVVVWGVSLGHGNEADNYQSAKLLARQLNQSIKD